MQVLLLYFLWQHELKKLLSTTTNKKKKHNIILMLPKSKSDIIETLVSQALIDL